MTARRENRPTAIIMLRKTSHRVATSCGVAADSDSDGITNCGAGPGFGPTAKVNAPRTGWPSAEIARQKTRYQPSRRGRSGTSSSSTSTAERCGGPEACCRPAASVTETTAKRGSTASEYTSATDRGGVLTSLLAAGTVRSSTACAHAPAGATSIDATQAASTSARL